MKPAPSQPMCLDIQAEERLKKKPTLSISLASPKDGISPPIQSPGSGNTTPSRVCTIFMSIFSRGMTQMDLNILKRCFFPRKDLSAVLKRNLNQRYFLYILKNFRRCTVVREPLTLLNRIPHIKMYKISLDPDSLLGIAGRSNAARKCCHALSYPVLAFP